MEAGVRQTSGSPRLRLRASHSAGPAPPRALPRPPAASRRPRPLPGLAGWAGSAVPTAPASERRGREAGTHRVGSDSSEPEAELWGGEGAGPWLCPCPTPGPVGLFFWSFRSNGTIPFHRPPATALSPQERLCGRAVGAKLPNHKRRQTNSSENSFWKHASHS